MKRMTISLLLIASTGLTGCSSMGPKISLNEPQSQVDASFGKSVRRMIEVQKRLRRNDRVIPVHQLEGWEAEQILNALETSK